MNLRTPLVGIGLAMLFQAGNATAQPPTVEQLQEQLLKLQTEMSTQRTEFEKQIGELKSKVDETLRQELDAQIDTIVAKKSKFYRRPDEKLRTFSDRSIFDALEGGLIFTGLFRSRFEYRANNVDFNPGEGGLDDEGVRFNGRFRLGFGAVVVRGGNTDPSVSALMEFQSVGTFANNTFFNFAGPGGAPLPRQFTIFREPYAQVNLYQGFLDIQRLLAEDLYIKVGRQEMTFGSELVLGNNAFYDGTVHDALLVEYEFTDFRVSAFYSKEAQSDTELAVVIPGHDFDEDEMAGVYLHGDVTENLDLEAYAIYFNARANFTDSFVTRSTGFSFDGAFNPAMSGHFWTLGSRAFWSHISLFDGVLALNAEAAYQTGHNGIGDTFPGVLSSGQSLHGWTAEAIANYWFDPSAEGLKPILTLAYYWAQGGEKTDSTLNGVPLRTPLDHVGYQPMFINRHFSNVRDRFSFDQPYFPGGGRYGNMDQIPLNNIHIIKAALTVGPTEKTELGLAGFYAITADDEGYGTGPFGYEIDLFGTYQYSPYVQFAANFSVFLPSRTAKDESDFYFFSGFDGKASDQPAFAFYLQALVEF